MMPAIERQESPKLDPKRRWPLSLVHRIVANPVIYDAVQFVAGARRARKVLANLLEDLPLEQARILDVGGGTGLLRALFPPSANYTCLDNDPQKLEGFRANHPDATAIEGNSTSIPSEPGTYDLAIICAMTHHLADGDLKLTVEEAARVLKPGGHLLFLDGLWEPRRLRSRILWRLDRGSFPRSFDDLRLTFSRRFTTVKEARWAVHHAYVAWLLAPDTNSGNAPPQ